MLAGNKYQAACLLQKFSLQYLNNEMLFVTCTYTDCFRSIRRTTGSWSSIDALHVVINALNRPAKAGRFNAFIDLF